MTALSVAVVLALSARAEAVVNELGSPSFLEREAAQAKLLAIGGPALPALNRAIASPDPEIARRARGLAKDILFQLDCRRLLAGTSVRLDYTESPLSTVLMELSRQSGYAVGVSKWNADLENAKVTIRTGIVPFWKAVETVGKASGLSITGLSTDTIGARFFVHDLPPPPKSPGEKIAAWRAEVEGMVRYSYTLDAQARGVLEAYRSNLRQCEDGVRSIEKAMGEKKANPGAVSAADRWVNQAENVRTAAKNLFTTAGVRVPIGPGGRFPVLLGTDPVASGSAYAGIWVEPAVSPPNVPQLAKKDPSGRSPAVSGPSVYLRVVPEPKIEWVRTTGLRVERAIDDRGKEVEPNLVAAPYGENLNEGVVFLGGGRAVRSYNPVTTIRSNPFYATVSLKADALMPTALREFRGAIQGIVKTAPEEVAARPLTVEPKFGAGTRPAGVEPNRLRLAALGNEPLLSPTNLPTLTASVKQELVGYSLSVNLQYSGDAYAPASGNGFDVTGRSGQQVVRVAQGRAVMVEQLAQGRNPGLKTESVYGLRVTDADGRPFQLSGGLDMTQLSADGTGPLYVHLTLVATASANGPPARITWHASRLAPVEVPFALANVPVVK